MQPLDDRTTCYTLIFWYFETADPTRGSTRPVYNSAVTYGEVFNLFVYIASTLLIVHRTMIVL